MASDPIEAFLALSAALTGFGRVDLLGTGMSRAYYAEVVGIVGKSIAGELVSTARRIFTRGRRDPKAREKAIRQEILADPKLGPVARNIIQMWYVGTWYQLPTSWRQAYGGNPKDVDHVVSADAYTQGLVWVAAGVHPAGAKQPGYGTWALPPRGATEDAGHRRGVVRRS